MAAIDIQSDKIKVLDLFCGVGGASVGYHRAGCDVTGVDIRKQPNYPFTFIQSDAVQILQMPDMIQRFDFIHASPPCQAYSKCAAIHKLKGKEYPDLLPIVRELLRETGKPYVIENVQEAPIREDLILDGRTFKELRVIRKRAFEFSDNLNWLFLFPERRVCKKGRAKDGDFITVAGKGRGKKQSAFKHHTGTYKEQRMYAMGMDWVKTIKEVNEAIPPVYTNFIMDFLKPQLLERQAAYIA